MSDLVERLRAWHRGGETITGDVQLYLDAAGEIERLREQLVKRTATLQEIADSTLYYGADLRSIASAALTDDQGTSK